MRPRAQRVVGGANLTLRSKLVDVLDEELLERIEAGGSTQDRLDTFYVRHAA